MKFENFSSLNITDTTIETFNSIMANQDLSTYEGCREFCVEVSRAYLQADVWYLNSLVMIVALAGIHSALAEGFIYNIMIKNNIHKETAKTFCAVLKIMCWYTLLVIAGFMVYTIKFS